MASKKPSTGPRHKGKMQCSCFHDLGSLSFPLNPKKKINHLDSKCLWDCCNQKWSISVCTVPDPEPEVDPSANGASGASGVNRELGESGRAGAQSKDKGVEGLISGLFGGTFFGGGSAEEKKKKKKGNLPFEDLSPEERKRQEDELAAKLARNPPPQYPSEPIIRHSDTRQEDNGSGIFDQLLEVTSSALGGVLGGVGEFVTESVILPVISPIVGFDRKELDETMSHLTAAKGTRQYREMQLKAASIYVEMLSLLPEHQSMVEEWIDEAVVAWRNTFGDSAHVVHIPFSEADRSINSSSTVSKSGLLEEDLLMQLLSELNKNFSGSLTARMSLAATLSQTRHLSETVFFDWYVMCRYNNIKFTIPEFSGFPVLTEAHTSATARVLKKQPAIFSLLKDRKSASGFTLDEATQAAVDYPSTSIGCVAGDEESYTIFRDLYVAVVMEEGIYATRESSRGLRIDEWGHAGRLDLDPTHISNAGDVDTSYVRSVSVKGSRNLRGFCLPVHCSRGERRKAEILVTEVLGKLNGDLEGTYRSLTESPQGSDKPQPGSLLAVSGGVRDWPYGRGIFATKDRKVVVWVNAGDHLSLEVKESNSASDFTGRLDLCFARWCAAINAIEQGLQTNFNCSFMRNDAFGFLTTSPNNVGTTLHVHMQLSLPTFRDPKFGLEHVCEMLGLKLVRLIDENGAVVDISMKFRVRCSETEQVQTLIDGARTLITLEKHLAAKDNFNYQQVYMAIPKSFAVREIDSGAPPLPPPPAVSAMTINLDDDVPVFSADHVSVCAKQLHPEVYAEMVSKSAQAGFWGISHAVRTAVDCPSTDVGVMLASEQSYEAFAPILIPVIKQLHGFDCKKDVHYTDMHMWEIAGLDAVDGRFLKKFRVSVSRNIRGFPMSPQISRKLRRTVEHLLYSGLSDLLRKDLVGNYCTLSTIPQEQAAILASRNRLPLKAAAEDRLTIAGCMRDWPDGRGLYANDEGGMYAWVNAEDHLQVFSEVEGPDCITGIRSAVHKLCSLLVKVEDSLLPHGFCFMHSQRLGYLNTSPKNLGTAMVLTFTMYLPRLTKFSYEIERLCGLFGLESVSSPEGESLWVIRTTKVLGITEAQLAQQAVDGMLTLIRSERDTRLLDPTYSPPRVVKTAPVPRPSAPPPAPAPAPVPSPRARAPKVEDEPSIPAVIVLPPPPADLFPAPAPAPAPASTPLPPSPPAVIVPPAPEDGTGTGDAQEEDPAMTYMKQHLPTQQSGVVTVRRAPYPPGTVENTLRVVNVRRRQIFNGEYINKKFGSELVGSRRLVFIDPLTKTLHWSKSEARGDPHKMVRFLHVTSVTPTRGSGVITAFTLTLRTGEVLSLKLPPDLSVESRSDWEKALNYFVQNPQLTFGARK